MKSFSTLLIFFTLFFTLCLWSCKKDEPTPLPQPDPEPTIKAGTLRGIVRYAGVLGESGLTI